jgi:hypothetical protein
MTRGHATTRRQEPLYALDVPTPTHAERARTLLSQLRTGSLATVAKDPARQPYPSFVTFASPGAGR